jgi:hypothetical protein
MRIDGKTYYSYFGFSKKFQGLGLGISFDEPYAMRKPWFTVEFIFLWFKCWFTKYKN